MDGIDTRPIATLPRAGGVMTRLACERLRLAGIAVPPLLRKAGLDPAAVEDPGRRLAVTAQIRFLNEAAEAVGDACIGFHLGQSFDLREGGLLYYVMASSDTLGEALRRGERYTSIANEAISLKCLAADELRLRFAYHSVARHIDRHQIEFWMTALMRVCRTLTGSRLQPSRIAFAHRPCEASAEIERFFGCGVEFGAPLDEAVLPGRAKEMPLVDADPFLNQILVRYCEEALAARGSAATSLRANVENAITPLLPHGRPTAAMVASRLGMSSRTLARRLASEGLTFARVLDELRSDLARRYLTEPDLSMSRIAWLLGYQEVSAFTHAVRRWTGRSPTAIRTALATGAQEAARRPLAPAGTRDKSGSRAASG